jgi:hypothetical protein
MGGQVPPQKRYLDCLATVDRLVNAVAVRDVAAQASFPCAHVNCVWVRDGYRKAPDRRSAFFVEDRAPRERPVGRLPHSAARPAEVVRGRIPGNSGGRQRAPSAKGADQAVLHTLERRVFLFPVYAFFGAARSLRSASRLIRLRGRRWILFPDALLRVQILRNSHHHDQKRSQKNDRRRKSRLHGPFSPHGSDWKNAGKRFYRIGKDGHERDS